MKDIEKGEMELKFNVTFSYDLNCYTLSNNYTKVVFFEVLSKELHGSNFLNNIKVNVDNYMKEYVQRYKLQIFDIDNNLLSFLSNKLYIMSTDVMHTSPNIISRKISIVV